MFDDVRRAVIPCGGRGTRMLSVTGGLPKELVRIAGTPIVEHVARECSASGITTLLIVVSPDKNSIVEHMRPLAGTSGMPARIEFVVQTDPRGLAHAIGLGRDFAAAGSLAVALPDNLFVDGPPALGQVAAVARASGKSAVAITAIGKTEAALRGATAIYDGQLVGGEFRIARIPDKGARSATFDTGGADEAYTGVGRYVFGPELWAAIDAVDAALPAGAELDDVPVMQRLLTEHLLTGCLIDGTFLDVGLAAGYREAVARLGGA